MKACPKCGASNDETSEICASCGASFETSDRGQSSSGPKMTPLKIWLIIDAVILAILVCLDIFLPYPVQAYIVLLCAVGVIALLVLLLAALVARWRPLPITLGLFGFVILLAVACFAFPKPELIKNGAEVLSMLRISDSRPQQEIASLTSLTSPSPSPSPTPSTSPSPSPTPSTSPPPSPSPSTSPSPSPSTAPSSEPTPSPVPAFPFPLPSPTPPPSPSLSPSPSPSATPVIATPDGAASPSPDSIIKVTAAALSAKYAENELAADRSYKDKSVQVSGVFESLSVVNGQIQVSIDDGKGLGTAYICCSFDDSYAAQLIDLHTGDQVSIQGICRGKAPTLKIDRCSLGQ